MPRTIPLVLLFLVFGQSPSGAGTDIPDLTAGYREAHAVLAHALATAGGEERILGQKSVRFALEGETSLPLQGYSVSELEKPRVNGRLAVMSLHDYDKERYRYELRQELPAGFELEILTFMNDGTLYNCQVLEKTYGVWQAPAVSPALIVDATAPYMPTLLLKRARENLSSLTYAGSTPGDEPLDAIEYAWDVRTRHRLVVARKSGRVRRLEVLAHSLLAGQETHAYVYSGSRTVDGLELPARVELYRGGNLAYDLMLTSVEIDRGSRKADVTLPEGFSETKQVSELEAVHIAGNLYEVPGIGGGRYRTPFVDLGDSIAVFDAPISRGATREILQAIRKALGEKPIGYVIVSHFHSDHVSGLGTYTDLGAKVVTVPENRDYLTRVVQARSRLFAVKAEPSRAPEFVDVASDALVLQGSEGRKIEVLQVGATPHVESMLVLYDPEIRTIVNGDLFSTRMPFNETFGAFIDWMTRQPREIESILGVHHELLSLEELRRQVDAP